jgi:hypothetical protein
VLLYYFGTSVIAYLKETGTLLSELDYVRPFRAPGQTSVYPTYGTYLWPQLPWLGTAAFAGWWLVGARGARDEAVRRVGGLCVMATLHGFVLRALGTEIHSVGAAWSSLPSTMVVVHALARRVGERWVGPSRAGGRAATAVGAVLLWGSTLLEWPTFARLRPAHQFTVRPGRPASDNRLDGLRFREATARGEWAGLFPEPAYQRDREVNEAAMYIDSITEDGEAVLVATHSHILHVHSFTQQVGGRYRFLFYMAHTGLLGRDALDRLAPGLLQALVRTPPRVIVSSLGYVPPLLVQLPELAHISRRFRPARSFGTILVLVRDDVAIDEGAGG